MPDITNAAPTVRLDVREHVAFITLARAEGANTMNLQFGREFLAVALAIRSNAAVRAVLMTGEGKNFCLGGDLKGMVASGSDIGEYLTELTTNLHAGMTRLARMDAPVIAAVNGTAAGAGLGLVLSADLAIAGRSAKFAPAYTGVGLTPDAGCSFWFQYDRWDVGGRSDGCLRRP
jgi:2-(1,2-epoxy-1,2-dihydrophenyl)acetyl-CoA isomerase